MGIFEFYTNRCWFYRKIDCLIKNVITQFYALLINHVSFIKLSILQWDLTPIEVKLLDTSHTIRPFILSSSSFQPQHTTVDMFTL